MAHIHSVYDNDTHFKIDSATREIKNESGKVVIIQHDHDSERFTFEISRMVEDHDMSTCNVVQIHYLNVDAATSTNEPGVYEVDDLQISPDSDDVVICSWLISRNATQFVGSLNFVVRFRCVADDGTVEYEWATAIHKGISVCESIYNADVIVAEYADVLEKWRSSLFFTGDGQGVTADMSMGGYRLTNVADPTEPTDAVNRKYLDEALENINIPSGGGGTVDNSDKVSKTGDIMAGELDMNTNKIVGLGDPEEDTDAANKRFVENKVASIDLTDQLDTKLGWDKLWENARPTSSFSAQNITVTNLSVYDVIAVESSGAIEFVRNITNRKQTISYMETRNASDVACFVRTLTITSNNGIDISQCNCFVTNAGVGVENGFAIPIAIYGVRKKEGN